MTLGFPILTNPNVHLLIAMQPSWDSVGWASFSGSLLLQSLGIHLLHFFGIPGTVWKVSISSKWQFWWGKDTTPLELGVSYFQRNPHEWSFYPFPTASWHRESGRFFTTIVSARQLYPPRQSCQVHTRDGIFNLCWCATQVIVLKPKKSIEILDSLQETQFSVQSSCKLDQNFWAPKRALNDVLTHFLIF